LCKYKKRIIPILHVEPEDSETWKRIDSEAAKRNWIYMRQLSTKALELSQRALEEQERILKVQDDQWGFIDNFDFVFENLFNLLESHKDFVRRHTNLLDHALRWEQNHRATQLLLVGKDRQNAEEWLARSKREFRTPTGQITSPPCLPTDLVGAFIMESKKNAYNMQCDAYFCEDESDRPQVLKILAGLSKSGYSTWLNANDISSGLSYEEGMKDGIVSSSNFVYVISRKSLENTDCLREFALARSFNKRIIPVVVEKGLDFDKTIELPGIEKLTALDFTDLTDELHVEVKSHDDVHADVEARRGKTPFANSLDRLVNVLGYDQSYFDHHRALLVQAMKWLVQKQNQSILLRGYNLQNAKVWLKQSISKKHPATDLHRKFIEESDAKTGMLGTEVFISYSRSDGDFARMINERLQLSGKTTWFDQESIASASDFQKEIYSGINSSDNFLFIISPSSVNSPYCADEVSYAQQKGKRMVTILHQLTDVQTLPSVLGSVQWINFINSDFNDAFSELLRTIDLDREYVQKHTRYLQNAMDWDEHGREMEYLLSGSAFTIAETWLETAFDAATWAEMHKHNPHDIVEQSESWLARSKKRPLPTLLQFRFLLNSKDAILKKSEDERKNREKLLRLQQEKIEQAAKAAIRQRFLLFISSAVAVVAVFFAIWGAVQTNRAIIARADADRLINLVANRVEDSDSTSSYFDLFRQTAIDMFKTGQVGEGERYLRIALETNDKPLWMTNSEFDANSYLENYRDLYASLITVHGGTFRMGNNKGQFEERPEHLVELPTFRMSRFEITNRIFANFLNEYGQDKIRTGEAAGKPLFKPTDLNVYYDEQKAWWFPVSGKESNPIVHVSWHGANEFCRFYGLRLPSEAEWEYAAIGGHKSKTFREFVGDSIVAEYLVPKYLYAGSDSISSVAAYFENTGQATGLEKYGTMPVGSYQSNAISIYDMSGNAFEWCSDWFSGNYPNRRLIKPTGPEVGTQRVLRGGHWKQDRFSCNVFKRSKSNPDDMLYPTGIRPAVDFQ